MWFSDGGRSEREESGGGVGGFEGGCMSQLGLLTCMGLNLCDSCLLMLLLLGFRGRLLLSSLAAGWARSLRVSEDSSMYARFSPKKSNNWQLAEEALWRGGEGRRIGLREGITKWGIGEERGSKQGAGGCLWLLFATDLYFSARISFSSGAVVMPAAPPSSMLLTVRHGWNLWSAKQDEEAEETSDLESKGDSDPETDPSCKPAPGESSSEVEWATGRENERAIR